jgi:putative oxidoreductase
MNDDQKVWPDRTAVDLSLLILRLVVGGIFMMHGSQKMFGAFEGPGLSAMVQPPPNGMGPLGYAVSIGEFFGGVGLVFGFLSRFSAASLIVIMCGAIAMVHGKNGFFLSQVSPKQNGFEYCLALIGLLIPILICGPGRISIGQFFLPKSSRTARPLVVLE